MEVRWSPEAADDLAAIVAYIRKDDSPAAQRTAEAIYERAGALTT
jgi:plasmid stabilization system protein ParE